MRSLELIIVEDDPFFQSIYTRLLSSTGYHASFCSTNELAINLFSLVWPDVVIVDLGLPDGDGLSAIKEIRNSRKETVPYIIVVTGSRDPKAHQQALDAGAELLLVKPMDESKFRSTLLNLAKVLTRPEN